MRFDFRLSFPESERVDWLNKAIVSLWPSVKGAAEVFALNQLNPLLEANKPSLLDSLQISRLELGSCSPLIEGVRVLSDTSGAPPSNTLTAAAQSTFSSSSAQIWIDVDVLWHGTPLIVLDCVLAPLGRAQIRLDHVHIVTQLRIILGPLVCMFWWSVFMPNLFLWFCRVCCSGPCVPVLWSCGDII